MKVFLHRITKGMAAPALMGLGMIVGCSSDDLSDMEKDFPRLVDIPPAPETSGEAAAEPAAVIQALREEAEARKAEGYQGPVDETSTPTAPAENQPPAD